MRSLPSAKVTALSTSRVESGLEVYRLGNELGLSHLQTLSSNYLGRVPGRMMVDGRSLWLTLPGARQIIEMDLMNGEFEVVRRFDTVDTANNVLTPVDILRHKDLLMVSTGGTGTVQAYALDSDASATAVADLRLTYLVQMAIFMPANW